MDNDKKSLQSRRNSMISWLTLQSIFIIFATIISFLIVELQANVGRGDNAHVITSSLGMIIPMCVLLGGINYFIAKGTYKFVDKLTEAIEKAAEGDFSVVLDDSSAGPYSRIYHNFNEMNKELQTVQTLRDDFVNSYSHEFKTPINSINGFASLLLNKDINEQDRVQYLQIIIDESNRLAELANSTILMSKLDSQQIVTNKTTYSLSEQVRQCVIILSPMWMKKNIEFKCDIDEIDYHGNYELMQQLLLNLMTNSIKYTDSGSISISMNKDNNNIVLRIEDTGIGMSEQTLNHLFDKYYQAKTQHSQSGLGLGLAIVKRVVDMCDGKIEVASKLAEGSTFIVALKV